MVFDRILKIEILSNLNNYRRNKISGHWKSVQLTGTRMLHDFTVSFGGVRKLVSTAVNHFKI